MAWYHHILPSRLIEGLNPFLYAPCKVEFILEFTHTHTQIYIFALHLTPQEHTIPIWFIINTCTRIVWMTKTNFPNIYHPIATTQIVLTGLPLFPSANHCGIDSCSGEFCFFIAFTWFMDLRYYRWLISFTILKVQNRSRNSEKPDRGHAYTTTMYKNAFLCKILAYKALINSHSDPFNECVMQFEIMMTTVVIKFQSKTSHD